MLIERNHIYNIDVIEGLKNIENERADIIIVDPPYNIGKDFGKDFSGKDICDNLPIEDYVIWCKEWIEECVRILKPNGTMFIYGFSEILAYLFVEIKVNKRWLIWHYTNKNIPSLNFWQHSHESIICCWKEKPIFNRDEIREPYTKQFLRTYAGKVRNGIKSRFGEGKETIYNVHPGGALPRDVIKVPVLSGWSGHKEGVSHPTQKPLKLCDKLIRSAKPLNGGLLIVPFVGSGSECVKAKQLGMDFLGFETNLDYIEIAKKRLDDVVIDKKGDGQLSFDVFQEQKCAES